KSFDAGEKDEKLSLRMTDALITELTNLKEIAVRPTSAVMRAYDEQMDPAEYGRRLGVDSLLEGKIQRVGDRIRDSVQLVRAHDNTPIWAGKFDENSTDVFVIEDSISERVAGALRLELTSKEKAGFYKRYTQNDEAHLAYIRGRYFWDKRTGTAIKKGIEYFDK